MTVQVIQPSNADVYLRQPDPTVNQSGENFLRINPDTTDMYLMRSVVQFNLPSIPASALSAASMALYYYENTAGGDPAGRTYRFLRLRRADWSESQATWNSYKTSNNWGTAGGGNITSDIDNTLYSDAVVPALVTVPCWMTWNVLIMAQDALTNQSNILRGLLKDNVENDYPVSSFYSRRYVTDASLCPKLTLTYTLPANSSIAKKAFILGF